VKSAGHGGNVGAAAAKQIKGRKRPLLVDTLGLVLGWQGPRPAPPSAMEPRPMGACSTRSLPMKIRGFLSRPAAEATQNVDLLNVFTDRFDFSNVLRLCRTRRDDNVGFGPLQPIPQNAADLRYGVSITDSCIGWEAM